MEFQPETAEHERSGTGSSIPISEAQLSLLASRWAPWLLSPLQASADTRG